jgi:hypothetical protein
VRNKWLRDLAFGRWVCLACGERTSIPSLPPKHECPSCHRKNWKYDELRFTTPYGLSGSLDLFLRLGNKVVPVEIKSVAKDEYAKLVAPYAEHRIRSSLYLRIVEDSGYKTLGTNLDLSRMAVLYISKAYGTKEPKEGCVTPFKEFWVSRDEEGNAYYLKKVMQVHEFKNGGAVPKGVCANSFCGRAKECSVIAECWGGKFGGPK